MLLSNEEKHADDFQASFHKEERRKNIWLVIFCLISRITDAEGFQEYLKLAGPTVKQYGGRVLVGGAVPENLEGDWHPRLFSIGEFESALPGFVLVPLRGVCSGQSAAFQGSKNKGIVVQGLQPRTHGPDE